MKYLSLSLSAVAAVLVLVTAAAANMQYVPGGAKAETERECSACHTFIPPQEEPMQEWRDILHNLPHHMGEDASLPEPLRSDIEAYLVDNASDGPEYRGHAR
jgi:hypothetical protein